MNMLSKQTKKVFNCKFSYQQDFEKYKETFSHKETFSAISQQIFVYVDFISGVAGIYRAIDFICNL